MQVIPIGKQDYTVCNPTPTMDGKEKVTAHQQQGSPLIADFRLLNYVPGQKIWFAAIPELLPGMARYGTVKEMKEAGVYELDPHPLVDWFGLIEQLEKISGMKRNQHEPQPDLSPLRP